MSLQTKIESEIQIMKSLVERYKKANNPDDVSVIVAYEYGLQALMEVYEASKQEEVVPF
ncbi:hypothetical protein [Bacillus sp. BP-3]|uniref:hypothetical protein n=1 Tax=Bacillus sp. BP-3 TaxID=3022773 RepID=UPI00232FA0DE|nr:hypothetical protein [Bacillus sp. BP-3]MDC2867534.1 hypothetical protein [Bacillus sp. BP-3]